MPGGRGSFSFNMGTFCGTKLGFVVLLLDGVGRIFNLGRPRGRKGGILGRVSSSVSISSSERGIVMYRL